MWQASLRYPSSLLPSPEMSPPSATFRRLYNAFQQVDLSKNFYFR